MELLPNKRQTFLVCIGLMLAVMSAYLPLRHCGFVLFDDVDYINRNLVAQKGVTWPGIRWAFSTFYASNWHPLTWISHMLDFQFYKMNPVGHHLTSLLLHLANSILLFLLLRRMTKTLWPAGLAAALFALHPMHVESVAWVSERKDVLSTLFWLLAVWAYAGYTEELARKGTGAKKFYGASIFWFACGLMAKPMLVTLPFVLLLLDYWPLSRGTVPAGWRIREKIPYFVLTAASSIVTFIAQEQGGAVGSLAKVSLGRRLMEIPIAYMAYLGKILWPAKLAVLYPFSRSFSFGELVGAIMVLLLISACAFWRKNQQPYLIVGWLWFLGMLAPVIGLVHVGSYFIADRYTYLPSVGLFIMVIWTIRDWIPRLGLILPAILGGSALLGCLAATSVQVGFWRNSETLFLHALDVTVNNSIIENDLAKLYLNEGRFSEALPHAQRAVELNPSYELAHYNLGGAYLALGRTAEALAQFEIQVKLDPTDSVAQRNFGKTLLDNGLAQDALGPLQAAVRLSPNAVDARCDLAEADRQCGHGVEAEAQFDQALKMDPNNFRALTGLIWMLSTQPDPALRNGVKAMELVSRLGESKRPSPTFLAIMAAAYAESGDFPKAASLVESALSLAGTGGAHAMIDTLRAQLALYRAGKPFRDVPGH